LESPVSPNNSTTTTASKVCLNTRQILSESILTSDVSSSESVEDNEDNTNLRRRRKVVDISQEPTGEGFLTSGIERDSDAEQSSSMAKNGQIHDNKAAIVRVIPSRNSLHQVTYYLRLISSQIFEGRWWQLLKLIIVVIKVISEFIFI